MVPLAAALSRLLVAYTMECDDAVESRLPHRTSRGPASASRGGPWLISLAFWANFLRLLDGPKPLRELPSELVSLPGMQRWGYLTIDPGRIVAPTAAGARARVIFADAVAETDQRWRDRGLRDELFPPVDPTFPRHLPMSVVTRPSARAPRFAPDPAGELYVLLARTLLRIADEVAAQTRLPMTLGANALRVVTTDGVREKDLPAAAGISREAAAGSVKALVKISAVTTAANVVSLTPSGEHLRSRYDLAVAAVESAVTRDHPQLGPALNAVLADREALVTAITPDPGGWRANTPYRTLTKALLADPAARLAAFPIVTHRGGYPDGS